MAKRRLRIGMVAPLSERVPPEKYGGTERVVHALTEELVKRGHKVTLFASGDSQTSAKLHSVFPRSLRAAKIKDHYGLNHWTLLNVATAYKMQGQFDIIHDHNSLSSIPTAQLATTPTVITIHGPLTGPTRRLYQDIDNLNYVAISKSQASPFPNIKITAVIYNGEIMTRFPFGRTHKNYLLVVGRISMEKGTHFAIDVAQDLNLPLVIAAKLDRVDLGYFNEYVGPRLYGNQITWVGEVDQKTRNRLMARALCLLHPVTWREPFGLAMIEAMACGCPVIGFNKGAIPEIIEEGKTGFVVNDIEEMAEAVENIGKISRYYCRNYAIKKFNEKRMTDEYEKLYFEILDKRIS